MNATLGCSEAIAQSTSEIIVSLPIHQIGEESCRKTTKEIHETKDLAKAKARKENEEKASAMADLLPHTTPKPVMEHGRKHLVAVETRIDTDKESQYVITMLELTKTVLATVVEVTKAKSATCRIRKIAETLGKMGNA